MLVQMRIDAWRHNRPIWTRLALPSNIDIQDPRQANLKLDTAILVEMVIPDVLVICERADHADDEATATDSLSAASRAIVSVFPEDTRVFLVDADNVLDRKGTAILRHVHARLQSVRTSVFCKRSTYEIVDLTETIAS